MTIIVQIYAAKWGKITILNENQLKDILYFSFGKVYKFSMSKSSPFSQTAIKRHECPSTGMTAEYFANKFFSLTVFWRDQLIHNIALGPGKDRQYSGHGATSYSDQIARAVKWYENKKAVTWVEPPLDWALITSPFQKQVLQALMKNIYFGQTTSYGSLARLSGNNRAARAVGRAMSQNPWPLIVPCHRVLTGKGTLGGFSSGLALKKILLFLENRVDQEMVANVQASD